MKVVKNGAEVVIFTYRNHWYLITGPIQSERKEMAMSKPESISVFFVALVSAAVHGSAAVLFVPIFSFLLLCWGTAPAQIKPSMRVDDGMVFAVIAPAL